MTNYNYMKAMEQDIKNYLEDEYAFQDQEDFDRDEFEQELDDALWCCDSVTGNGSGSYTFNRAEAKEYVECNLDLLKDACDAFCVEPAEIGKRFLAEDWEYFDVTIRCYYLREAISNVLDEIYGG